MEKEINRLQDKISSLGSEADMKSEISDLRFDKEALERKLRKFATHCQRLEDDKAGITDALGSCNIDVEAHGSVISEAIIHLCDKFMSIEEALEKQQSNPSFEKEKQSMQRKIQNLSHSENELIEKLNQYQREKSDLEIQLENAKKEISNGESEEHREKLRFLEHENLQLMQDVKSTKRQLQTAREEVETLRMNVDQSPTSDFGGLDIRTSTKDTIHSLTTYAKENSDTMELTNLAKACSKDDTDDVMRRSTRLTKKRTVLADNTNGTRNEERRKRSINKRQKVNALFETKHAMNPTGVPGLREPSSIGTENMKQEMNRSGTPRLGETSSLDTENTGECKQS
jgi:chromosome segregation ATPase